MSKRKSSSFCTNRPKRVCVEKNLHPVSAVEFDEHGKYVNASIIISAENDSGDEDSEQSGSDDSESDSESNVGEEDSDSDDSGEQSVSDKTNQDPEFPFSQSYDNVYEKYNNSQKKLEPDYDFKWTPGEFHHDKVLEDNIMLGKQTQNEILKSTPTQLFERFFSLEIKNYIIACTKVNGLEISLPDLEVFIGIIIFTTYNQRLSQRDYWSKDPHLKAEPVASAMGLKKFEKIKSKFKFNRPEDEDDSDEIWRVRKIVNIFRKNLLHLGIFTCALSIDEMMLKFFGRSILKQFIRGKPIRFGIKLWALCSAQGYLYDFEIYCGKNHNKIQKLSNCALGSRVVMNMLQPVLQRVTLHNRNRLHIYFDNLFTSPDLLIHLKKFGLCATGTVRDNRVNVKNNVVKKDERGKYDVKNDRSGLNFVTVKDSKPVSILSTGAGVMPLGIVKRRQKGKKEKQEFEFPRAFLTYNQFMGGVDLHDQRCNKIQPIVRSKKWTWVIFIRMLQTAITNSVVLFNTCNKKTLKKASTKSFAMSIGKTYLSRGKSAKPSLHKIEKKPQQKYCVKCGVRSRLYCNFCFTYYCQKCFNLYHPKKKN